MKLLIELKEGDSTSFLPFLPDVSRTQIEDENGNVIFCAVEEGGEMLHGIAKERVNSLESFKESCIKAELRDGTITTIHCFSSLTVVNEKGEKFPAEFASTYFLEGKFIIKDGYLPPKKRCLKKARKQYGKLRHQKMAACAH